MEPRRPVGDPCGCSNSDTASERIVSTPAGTGGAPLGSGEGGRSRPVGDNQALLYYSKEGGTGTCPARFLEVGRWEAALLASARPTVGALVGVCMVEPAQTDWIEAAVVGVELAGDGPYQVELAFVDPLPDSAVAAMTARRAESRDKAERNSPKASPCKVLVVDDHEQTRGALVKLLRLKGYDVAMAGTVADGLAQLKPPPCCIVLDLVLPDGGGEAILWNVRTENLPTRVVVCTGTHDKARLDAVGKLRPQALLRKPIQPDEVVQACLATSAEIGV